MTGISKFFKVLHAFGAGYNIVKILKKSDTIKDTKIQHKGLGLIAA
jgi:hypothetical protein